MHCLRKKPLTNARKDSSDPMWSFWNITTFFKGNRAKYLFCLLDYTQNLYQRQWGKFRVVLKYIAPIRVFDCKGKPSFYTKTIHVQL